MSWMPEPEPTPLRLRLGPRAEPPLPVPPVFEDAHVDSATHADEIDAPIQPTSQLAPAEDTVAAGSVESKDPLRAAASEELQRAIEQTSDRVERWMADQ